MVAVASCFAQILALIDRAAFARAIQQHAAERAAKGFGCWDHFVAMLFCQVRGEQRGGRPLKLFSFINDTLSRFAQ